MTQIDLPRRVPDFKDRDGNWVIGYGKSGTTVSGKRWKDMVFRCTNSRHRTYKDCSVGFKDFQEFAEWSQQQCGHLEQGWELDKDLLFKGNKIYSRNTCVFLPQEVNAFLVGGNAKRGIYLKGVSFKKSGSKFMAQCHRGTGVPIVIGLYLSELEAHLAYKRFKEDYASELAERWKEKIDPRAYAALKDYRVSMED